MPRYIIKLNDGNRDWYLDWSDSINAPVTYGMSQEEFTQYYEKEYGASNLSELEERLKRVEERGTSSRMHISVEELLRKNCAGPGETHATLEQIIARYCYRKDESAIEETK